MLLCAVEFAGKSKKPRIIARFFGLELIAVVLLVLPLLFCGALFFDVSVPYVLFFINLPTAEVF